MNKCVDTLDRRESVSDTCMIVGVSGLLGTAELGAQSVLLQIDSIWFQVEPVVHDKSLMLDYL